jgi:hypothetical protein
VLLAVTHKLEACIQSAVAPACGQKNAALVAKRLRGWLMDSSQLRCRQNPASDTHVHRSASYHMLPGYPGNGNHMHSNGGQGQGSTMYNV